MHEPRSIEQGAKLDLAAVEAEVRLEDAYKRDGHSACSLIREHDLRVVLIAMQAGAHIAAHRASASVAIQTLRGHARIRLADRTVELPVGRALVFRGGLEHDLEAVPGDRAAVDARPFRACALNRPGALARYSSSIPTTRTPLVGESPCPHRSGPRSPGLRVGQSIEWQVPTGMKRRPSTSS